MNIEDLMPAEYNPRKDLQSGDPEYEKLKKSILEFDYIDPIIWNERTGRVVGGHLRE
jgi:ParB-like chromosome segregation protein Spo0J